MATAIEGVPTPPLHLFLGHLLERGALRPGIERHDSLAGVHAHAHPELGPGQFFVQRGDGDRDLKGGANGALGVVTWDTGAPNTAITASPMNF